MWLSSSCANVNFNNDNANFNVRYVNDDNVNTYNLYNSNGNENNNVYGLRPVASMTEVMQLCSCIRENRNRLYPLDRF